MLAAPAYDFRRCGGGPSPSTITALTVSPPKAVGDAHHADLLHCFMPHDDLLDLGRIDVLPSGLDQISFAVNVG